MVPDGFPYPLNQIVMVPIDDLEDPEWNPRPIVEEAPLQDLVDYLQSGGKVPPIEIWVGDGKKPHLVIAGKRRRLAYRRLGRTAIEGIFIDCSFEEARRRAVATNQGNKPYWLGEYERAEFEKDAHTEIKSNAALGVFLGKSKTWGKQAISMMKLLSKETRALIYTHFAQKGQALTNSDGSEKNTPEIDENGTENPSKSEKSADNEWFLTEYPMTGILPLLKGRPQIAAMRLADRAVPFIIRYKMALPKVKRLVKLLIEGKSDDEITEIFEKKPPGGGSGSGPGSGSSDEGGSDDGGNGGSGGSGGGGGSTPSIDTPKKADETPETVETAKEPKVTIWANLNQIWQGFFQAGLKSLLGKLPKNPLQAVGFLLWTIPWGILRILGKISLKACQIIWNRALKYVHQACKAVANRFAPLKGSSSHSSHSGSRSGQDPLAFLAHYAVYWLLTLVFYSLLLSFIGYLIPPSRPWINIAVKYLGHFFAQLPLWILWQILKNAWIAFALGVVLMIAIFKTYKPKPLEILLYAVLLIAVWWSKVLWMRFLPEEPSFSIPRTATKTQTETNQNEISPPRLQDTKNDQGLDNNKPQNSSVTMAQLTVNPAPPSRPAGSSIEPAQPSHGPQLVASVQMQDTKKTQRRLTKNLKLNTQTSSTPALNVAAPKHESAQANAGSEVPAQYQERVQQEKVFLNVFAGDLFGPSYHDIQGWMATLKGEIMEGYQDQFFYENYPPAKIQEIQDKKWKAYFKPTQPPQWQSTDSVSDEFLVQGVVTTQSDLHYQGEVVSTQPITLKVRVYQGAQGPHVTKVEKAVP